MVGDGLVSLEFSSGKAAFSCSGHQRVTHTVRQCLLNNQRLAVSNHETATDTALPYNDLMEFIKATAFTKYVYDYLSEDEYLGLQSFLLQSPEAGKIVQGSGGVRKVRWAIAGKGISGGVRVI